MMLIFINFHLLNGEWDGKEQVEVTQGKPTTKDWNFPKRGNPCSVLTLILSPTCLYSWRISKDGETPGSSNFKIKNHSRGLENVDLQPLFWSTNSAAEAKTTFLTSSPGESKARFTLPKT